MYNEDIRTRGESEMSNQSKYINPKKCLTCGKCCESFTIVYDKNASKDFLSEVKRFACLDTRKITIKETKEVFLVTFNYKCRFLKENKGQFRCKIYNGDRPELCKNYPFEKTTDCPHKLDKG